jgi:hypothetical protein
MVINLSSSITSNDQDNQQKLSETEFDFMINCIWSHIVGCLDLNLSIIFSPADPDIFHQNFTISFDFLNRLETKCSLYDKEFKRKLLNSQSYKYFVKKWPIQVYYQIRFQEIVTKFEEDLLDHAKLALNDDETNVEEDLTDLNQNTFKLAISNVLVSQMEYCWLESSCFLKCLLAQFWKLNLQLISRYCMFFIDLFQNKSQAISTTAEANSLNTQVMQHVRTGSGIGLENNRAKTPTDEISSQNRPLVNMSNKVVVSELDLSIMLLTDAHKLFSVKVRYLFTFKITTPNSHCFSDFKLPNFFDGVIAPIIRLANATKNISILKEGFSCSLNNLNELQLVLIDYIVKYETEKCTGHLKSASDIPRLYRRTNREAPKTPSMYVGLTVEVINEFRHTYTYSKSSRQQELINKCIQNIIDYLCIK